VAFAKEQRMANKQWLPFEKEKLRSNEILQMLERQ